MNSDPLYELESENLFLASILLKGSPGLNDLQIEPEDFIKIHKKNVRIYERAS